MSTIDKQQPTAYVAIGGSAGGLNAYQAFFSNMPPRTAAWRLLLLVTSTPTAKAN